MNRCRTPDFSNPYSPKNRSIRAHLAKTLSFSLNGHPNDALNIKKGNKIVLQRMPDVRGATMQLNQQKIDRLNEVLELQKECNKAHNQRLRTDNYYLNFDRNPLSELIPLSKNRVLLQKGVGDTKKLNHHQTLLQSLQQIKEKSDLNKIRKPVNNFVSFANLVVTREMNKHNAEKAHKIKAKIQSERMMSKTMPEPAFVVDKSQFDDLQGIMSLRDQNFFQKKRNRQPFNIFNLVANPGHPMFYCGREHLEKLQFSFDSVISHPKRNLNGVFHRSLSTYARVTMLNNKAKCIPDWFNLLVEGYRMVELSKLTIDDLLLIASGQVKAEQIMKALSEDHLMVKVPDQKEQVHDSEDQLIVYDPNTRNQLHNYLEDNRKTIEMAYLQQECLSKIEKRQINVSEKYLKEMRKILQNQLQTLNRAIRDIEVHKAFGRQKDVVLGQELLDDIESERNMDVDLGRKIRRNKFMKDQTEKLKLQCLVNTCKERNELRKMIQQSSKSKSKQTSRKRSKSKSNSKYFRKTIK